MANKSEILAAIGKHTSISTSALAYVLNGTRKDVYAGRELKSALYDLYQEGAIVEHKDSKSRSLWSLPCISLYYIQNGYVGNAIAWWGIDRKGYTTEITSAGKYTLAEVSEITKRPQDVAWPCEYIDNNTVARKTIIDMQYLDSSMAIGKTKL